VSYSNRIKENRSLSRIIELRIEQLHYTQPAAGRSSRLWQ